MHYEDMEDMDSGNDGHVETDNEDNGISILGITKFSPEQMMDMKSEDVNHLIPAISGLQFERTEQQGGSQEIHEDGKHGCENCKATFKKGAYYKRHLLNRTCSGKFDVLPLPSEAEPFPPKRPRIDFDGAEKKDYMNFHDINNDSEMNSKSDTSSSSESCTSLSSKSDIFWLPSEEEAVPPKRPRMDFNEAKENYMNPAHSDSDSDII